VVPCFIYALTNVDTGRLKVGISRGPEGRMADLQQATDCELAWRWVVFVHNTRRAEIDLLASLEAHRHRGEWLRPTAVTELDARMAELAQRPGSWVFQHPPARTPPRPLAVAVLRSLAAAVGLFRLSTSGAPERLMLLSDAELGQLAEWCLEHPEALVRVLQPAHPCSL
jgi:hypothetical protein